MNRGFFAAAAALALCLHAGTALAGAQETTRASATSTSSRTTVVPARHVQGDKRDKKAPAAKRAPRRDRSTDDLEMPQLG